MPNTSYNFSITNNFNDSIDTSQLQTEIESSSLVLTTIVGITTDGDDVKIIFNTNLPTNEEAGLNQLVNDHVPVFAPILSHTQEITPHLTKSNYTSYHRIADFIFPGSTYASFIVLCKMDLGVTSYNLRIYDVTNFEVLVEKECTNLEIGEMDLGFGENIPVNRANIELHVKTNTEISGTYTHVKFLTINYG